MDPHKIEAVLNDLIALPEVKNAGFGCDVPIYGAAGNNILSPDGGERVLFNLADFYYIDENYFSILDIPPVIEGKGFKKRRVEPAGCDDKSKCRRTVNLEQWMARRSYWTQHFNN